MDILKKRMYHQDATWYICGVTEKDNNMAQYLICPPGPFAPTPELLSFRKDLLTMDQDAPEVIQALEEVDEELKARKLESNPGPKVGTKYKRRKREFSDAWIETAPAGIHSDSGCRGLRLRVSPDGAIRSFYFQYQLKNGGSDFGKKGHPRAGKLKKIAIGRWPSVTLAAARVKANELRAGIATNGKAPDAGPPLPADQPAPADWTFGRVGKIILDQTDNPTTHGDFRRYFDKPLGHRPVAEITRDDVLAVLDVARGDGTARSVPTRVLGTLRGVFGWVENNVRGMPKGWVNPTAGIKRTFKKNLRKRLLSRDELRAIWAACEDTGCDGATKLLVLTGQRRTSAGKAQWSHFDLAKKVWTIPQHLQKGGVKNGLPPLTVHLSPPAMALLKRLYAQRGEDWGPYVFTMTEGRTPTTKWDSTKERLDAKCGVEDWVRHNLRHAFCSGTASLGVMPWITSQCVGHTLKGFSQITAGYTHADFEKEKRKAMNDWAKHLGV